MNIARKIGPFVAIGSFVAAGACAGSAPPSAPNMATTPAPTDTDTAPTAATAAPTTTDPAPTAAASATAAAPAMPAYEEQKPPAKEPAKKAKRAIADGRPKGLKAGANEAYWVWLEGSHWRVRTTTHDQMHRFQGAIVSEEGSIADVKATRAEYNDRLKVAKDTIGFDFQTNGNEDGFDFDAPEDKCVSFFLLIDGKPHVDRVNVGKNDTHPPHWNFKLCK